MRVVSEKKIKGNIIPAVVFIILILSLLSPAAAQDFKVEFKVSMEKPWNHYYDVEMKLLDKAKDKTIDLIMPVWIPGSYMVREYPQFLQEEKAFDINNEPLKFEKTAKNRWKIYLNKTKSLVFKYRIFAFEKTIRHCYLTDTRAVINGPHMFIHPEKYLKSPVKIKIIPFEKFKEISTGMTHSKEDKFTLYAKNFDQIYDSPIEVGNQQILQFDVRGVPHYISLSGNKEKIDTESLIKHTKNIVEEAVNVIGEIPYKKYVFFMAMGIPGGGLEHSNSTFLGLRSWGYDTESSVKSLLGLISHEFFHVWNVKRIRPYALGPFDYSRENYTKQLWIAEGLTVYFDQKIRLRAGYTSIENYISNLANSIHRYDTNPGRHIQSLEEASFDAWIKSYHRHQNSGNTTISYYGHGALAGTVLDLIIIDATNGEKDLDDLMKYLYEEYYKKQKRGFKPEEFKAACEKLSGRNLDEIFTKYISGRETIDFEKYLKLAGMKLDIGKSTRAGYPLLGISIRENNGRLITRFVTHDSPAYNQGLSIGDEIIALNGIRVTSSRFFYDLLNKNKPGMEISLLIARDEMIKTLNITLAGEDDREFKISKAYDAEPKQKIVYKKWTGMDF